MVSIDAVQWTSEQGMQFTFYHMIDSGTNFQVAFTCEQGTSKEVSSKMVSHWFNWAGPPKTLMSDSAGEFCSDEFAAFLQSHDIQSVIIPAEAHWQMGKVRTSWRYPARHAEQSAKGPPYHDQRRS